MRLTVTLLVALAGCSQPTPAVPPAPADRGASSPEPIAADTIPPAAAGEPAAGEIDARFVPHIAAAFREYKAWGRVDDELRWAPWLCRMPLPGRARMSGADDGGHARKLYSVLAKDHDRYPGFQEAPHAPQPVGQTVVKESYHPEAVKAVEPPSALVHQDQPIDRDHFHPYASEGGQLYRASRMAGIYVVLKLPAGTAGTDAGWVYGTATPGGEVTSAGRVASCMGCHVSAPHERLFGLGHNSNVPGLAH